MNLKICGYDLAINSQRKDNIAPCFRDLTQDNIFHISFQDSFRC